MEAAVLGIANISRLFGKRSWKNFWARHGEELKSTGIAFPVRIGCPPIRMYAAFPQDLRSWARLKARKGEVI